ncbi:MAG: sulfurtransferase [Halomonas sp.]|jgi:thiosulfate/3-mercaptopyruvate sulfurtransferase|uniref:Sulfurtransferase n=1 Tax=Billgrantia tianxiuensis TaxID=2497861 RepID=A0A6I6SQA9_9GAMM|nr:MULTISPECIES: sulfurtransferase [Halomonas]MCE8032338.1 sulfurtransferase [Halomonas sp. MCCC 1A11057]MDX5434084.1 sulfurtransferase [Halomonas sp.]QHC49675.1 sulfurtransferase [Halomonas tianxiuensis]
MRQVLITANELADSLRSRQPPLVLDCRARLGDGDAGRRLWEAGHVPGSLHLDLDRDLAAAPGEGGRHPLPTPEAFTATLQRLGVSPDLPVVVLDDMGGQLAAARAWWMLAVWAGHPDVRVLDGGLRAWQEAGGELLLERTASPEPSRWQPTFDTDACMDADRVFSGRELKVDARSEERFRGEAEPIDPVAGHIPGAVCRPSAANLDEAGRFKGAETLEAELPRGDAIVAYCGSGVTACHNILAYAIAGRPLPRLYPGSWSEWVRDPSRPVARSTNRS